MQQRITFVHITFDNIYLWGKGFRDTDTAQKWETYWQNIDSTFWRYVPGKGSSCGLLTGMCGSIYLHPIGFQTVLRNLTSVNMTVPGTQKTKAVRMELHNLHELCRKAAQQCGGSFSMSVSDETYFSLETKPYAE